MTPCRCGHGRHHHRATANAIRKARRVRGAPPKASCQAKDMSAYRSGHGAPTCKCRGYVPAVPA